MIRFRHLLLMGLFSPLLASAQLALIGDSATTGAANGSRTSMDAISLLGGIIGELITYDPQGGGTEKGRGPLRLYWDEANYLAKEATKLMDEPSVSWGYQLGLDLGFEDHQILMTAQDGQRSSSFDDQVNTLLEYTQGQLPQKIFVQFTGNDLCKEENFQNWSPSQYEEKIFNDLVDGLEVLEQAKASFPQGSELYILPFFDLSQLLLDSELLSQKVKVHNLTLTCEDLQSQFETVQDKIATHEAIFNLVKASRTSMCEALLKTKAYTDTKRIQKIQDLVKALRRAQKSAALYANEILGNKGVRAHYLAELEGFRFQKGELASDCFHPGQKGHQRLAEEIKKALTQ